MVVAGRTTSDTCDSYTLKCSTSKTAWGGKTTQVTVALYNKAKGTTEDVDVGMYWNSATFFPGKSKISLKGYEALSNYLGLYYEGVTMKKSAKIQAVLDVECAATTDTVFSWADTGDCFLEVDCPVIEVKLKENHSCSPRPPPNPIPANCNPYEKYCSGIIIDGPYAGCAVCPPLALCCP